MQQLLRFHASKMVDCLQQASDANKKGDVTSFNQAKLEMYNTAMRYQRVHNELNPIHKAMIPNAKEIVSTIFKEAKKINL